MSIYNGHVLPFQRLLVLFQLRDAGVMALNFQREKETLSADYNELKQMFDTANECLEMLQNVQVNFYIAAPVVLTCGGPSSS